MKKFLLSSFTATALISAMGMQVQASNIVTESFTMSTTALIPDDDASGVLQMIMPSTSIVTLDHVSLTLNTTGGWNGDLFAYIWHNGTLTVLVNRPARTTTTPDGSSTSGLTLTFNDTAATDIHSIPAAGSGMVTGTFQPDGRNVDPLLSLDTSPRTQQLSSFNGMPASGEWRLFVADLATGDQATLVSWSVTLTGSDAVIPEPATGLLALLPLGLLAAGRRRQQG